MRYETAQMLKDEGFKRSTGIWRKAFEQMLQVVEIGLRDFGRPTKLCRADWKTVDNGQIGILWDLLTNDFPQILLDLPKFGGLSGKCR